jgi:hypothetical protein
MSSRIDYETLDGPSSSSSGSASSTSEKKLDDFSTMFMELVSNLKIKVALILFIFSLFIFSDIFIDNVLVMIKGANQDGFVTSFGTIIQILFITIGFLLIDLLVSGKII